MGGEIIVIIVEELRQEIMAVGIIIVDLDIIFGALHATLCADGLGLRVLLRHESGESQFAELQFSLHAEESRTAADQARSGGHADITGLDILDDFILLAFILEFKVLRVKREGSVGVIAHIELHLIADGGIDSGLYLLVEVEIGLASIALGESRVVGEIALDAHRELD